MLKRSRSLFVTGAAVSALVAGVVPQAHASAPVPAERDRPAASGADSQQEQPGLTARMASADSPTGVVLDCRVQQEAGDPHVRTSTNGAGVKASVRCNRPVERLSLTGQMYHFWGPFDMFWSASGPPATTVTRGLHPTELYNKELSAPCANKDMTWWYGEFTAMVTFIDPAGNRVTRPAGEIETTTAEIPCGPVTD